MQSFWAVHVASAVLLRGKSYNIILLGAAAFHLAFPVRDVEEARRFYVDVLGCTEGRSAATWQDFNFYGHQIVAHRVENYTASANENAVDGDAVPVPHFGAALSVDRFHELAERVRAAGVEVRADIQF